MKMRLLLSGLALLLGIIPVPADITNGLVAYYNFEGLAGTVGETIVDQSGHGHDGVCRQDQGTLKAPALVPGPDGLSDALNFDGSFYVQIPNRPDFNISDNITLAAWISVDALTQDWQTIFCRGDWSWRLHRNGGSDYACFHMSGPSGGYGADGQTINIRVPKRWLHVVGTYKDGVGAKLYINGTLEASNPGVSGLINTDGDDPVTIGAQINNGSLVRQWQGQIDEVRLYGRALSATDVSELFGFVQTNFNSRPLVIVPADQVLNAPTNLLLAVTVSDDGKPLPADPANPSPNDPHKLRWNWSVVSAPSASAGVVWSGNSTNGEAFTYQGSSNPPGTVFTCRPTATFAAPGIYTLQFGANDGEKASSKNVTVWVRSRDDYRSLGYVYLSPLPGAEYTPTQTRFVLVRFQNVSPTSITNLSTFIRVNGVQSGVHTGQTKIAGDGRTVIFEMTADFVANEMVTVSLTPGVPTAAGGPVQPYLYQFVTSGHLPGLLVSSLPGSAPSTLAGGRDIRPAIRSDLTASNGVAGIMPNGVSVPSDFPWINITVNNKPDPEPIFIDNRGGNGRPYNVIFDNTGSPIWYRRMPDERRDMKVQHNGVLTMLARDNGQYFYGMNTNYQTIATYRTVNGYSVDEHELQVLADGTYFLIGLHSENVDLSRYIPGGSSSASVTEDCIQQFTPAGELIFQWRAWDYLDIASQQYVVTPTNPGDFPHMNAIDVDTDGHILLSGRNTSEVTKINRDTGQIIWRLGGTHNQFTFANDPLNGPRNQHSVRSVGTNRYTLFDNGNGHSPQVSRAVEYLVNPTNMTATVIWRYPATPT
ncbi:MAG: aryl-sulfate sulfotransferase, partial [Verrucomicrobia bacterium]|nr:aryl-sulfate sulfotransferase [Verrucomicrobiota bacterium]